MKRYLILILILTLVVGFSSSVFAESIGLGYGFFEGKESGADVDGLILTSESDFANDYNMDMRYFIGDGDYDYEANLLDFGLYKRMSNNSNTQFYLGVGWKWLTEDQEYNGYAINTSQWSLPILGKMEFNAGSGLNFGSKFGYWFLGSYDAESNFFNDFDGDFTGFSLDLYAEKIITENSSVKIGYANEDYSFEGDSSLGINDFDGGFDGFYFVGQVNY
ncbi:MAG: hypothetical protein K9K76_09975 [Halanaerobiales bacterium]|nr:hypothetical protein [Halanaerobiales bacterium]